MQYLLDADGHDTVGSFGLQFTFHLTGVFDIDKSHLQLTTCPGHLESFGITWKSNKKNCTAPISVKGERGITLS